MIYTICFNPAWRQCKQRCTFAELRLRDLVSRWRSEKGSSSPKFCSAFESAAEKILWVRFAAVQHGVAEEAVHLFPSLMLTIDFTSELQFEKVGLDLNFMLISNLLLPVDHLLAFPIIHHGESHDCKASQFFLWLWSICQRTKRFVVVDILRLLEASVHQFLGW